MLPIYTRPRTTPTQMTLQATAETWQKAVDIMEGNNEVAYVGLITPALRDTQPTDIVRITLTNKAAAKILHFFGLSA